MTAPVAPFDALAVDYDRTFTGTPIGRLMRDAVWRRLEAAFAPGMRVLELNCGTGEDAVFLARRGVRVVATDVSEEMVSAAQAKVNLAGLHDRVDVARLDIASLATLGAGRFDGTVSNFGGLNCVADLSAASHALAALLRPGSRAVLCLMGPAVPWEWGWFLARGDPANAFRRMRPRGAPWRGITVRYPTIGQVRRAFASGFRPRRVAAIGALVPPPYAGDWAERHPRLLAGLNRWERRLETLLPLPWLADHFLLELERR